MITSLNLQSNVEVLNYTVMLNFTIEDSMNFSQVL